MWVQPQSCLLVRPSANWGQPWPGTLLWEKDHINPRNASWNSANPRPSTSMESPPDIASGRLNHDTPRIYIRSLSRVNDDAADGTSCQSVTPTLVQPMKPPSPSHPTTTSSFQTTTLRLTAPYATCAMYTPYATGARLPNRWVTVLTPFDRHEMEHNLCVPSRTSSWGLSALNCDELSEKLESYSEEVPQALRLEGSCYHFIFFNIVTCRFLIPTSLILLRVTFWDASLILWYIALPYESSSLESTLSIGRGVLCALLCRTSKTTKGI